MFAGFSPAAGDGFRLRLHSRIKAGGALPGERSSAPCTPRLVRQWLRIKPRAWGDGLLLARRQAGDPVGSKML